MIREANVYLNYYLVPRILHKLETYIRNIARNSKFSLNRTINYLRATRSRRDADRKKDFVTRENHTNEKFFIDESCPITMKNYNDNTELTLLKPCRHSMSREAFEEYTADFYANHENGNPICPICRQEIRETRFLRYAQAKKLRQD